MSLYVLIIIVLCAQLLLNILMLFIAFRISTQSPYTFESGSDNALEEWKDPITARLPKVDHNVWSNQPTFHVLPAWNIYEGPTHPQRAVKHQFIESNIGYSQKGFHTH